MIKLETTTAYTVQEVAEILHKRPATVRVYINNGLLKARKVGKPWYITERALEEFINGKPTR